MNPTLHIVSNRFVKMTLEHMFHQYSIQDEVIFHPDTFVHGPLPGNFGETELKKRSEVLDDLFKQDEQSFYDTMKSFVAYDFEKYAKIVVWHGDNTEERLMLYYVCSLIKRDLFEVDVTFIKPYLPYNTGEQISMACCSPECLRRLYDTIAPVSTEQKQINDRLWQKWSASKAPLRIWNDTNEIVEAQEDYFDELLLSKCENDYIAPARIVGTVLADFFCIGDSYLFTRIEHLIKSGKLVATPNERDIRDIEISDKYDKNKVVVNGINITHPRFYLIKRTI